MLELASSTQNKLHQFLFYENCDADIIPLKGGVRFNRLVGNRTTVTSNSQWDLVCDWCFYSAKQTSKKGGSSVHGTEEIARHAKSPWLAQCKYRIVSSINNKRILRSNKIQSNTIQSNQTIIITHLFAFLIFFSF